MAYKCILVDYFDVWENPEDGWEVNNLSRENVFYMNDDYTDEDMIKKLIEIGYLKADVKMEDFDIWSDGYVLEAYKADDQMPLFMVELEDVKPIATLCLSNFGGIAIFEINDYENIVTYQWYNEKPETVCYYYDEGEAYFVVGDTNYYFNQFMRI